MDILTRDAIAEPATLDVEAWRRALRGVDLVVAAIMAAFVGLGLFAVIGLPVALFLAANEFTPAALGILIGFAVYFFVAAALLLPGVGLCCVAPNDFGAKRYAQAAFVLSLTALTLIGAFIAMELVILPNVSQQWFILLARVEFLYPMLGIMLFLNMTLAVACWHHFLNAVAETFGQPLVAASLKSFLASVYAWGGSVTLSLAISAVFGVLPGAIVFLGFLSFVAAMPFGAWSVSLLLELQKTMRETLVGPTSGNVQATVDPHPD